MVKGGADQPVTWTSEANLMVGAGSRRSQSWRLVLNGKNGQVRASYFNVGGNNIDINANNPVQNSNILAHAGA